MPSSKTRVIRYHLSLIKLFTFNKQIFYAFFYNIRDYSPEVINIILPRVNNFDIKQKKAWNICFIICHQHQTRSGKIKTKNTQVFFLKAELRHIKLQLLVNHFILFLLIFFLK